MHVLSTLLSMHSNTVTVVSLTTPFTFGIMHVHYCVKKRKGICEL